MEVPWPEPLVRFVQLFNRKWFWESHEVLEAPWRENRSDFYQGLIIYASVFVHALRGNPVGVKKQLAKVPGKLEPYRPYYMGIDVEEILEHGRRCRQLVDDHAGLRGRRLQAAMPYPTLALNPRLLRGDETEWDPPRKAAEGTSRRVRP